MRRSLVQGDDAARHPFLQSLPRHVRHGAAPDPVRRRNRIDARDARAGRAAAWRRAWRRWRRGSAITLQDVKDFLMAYCACFMAAMAFFA
ncbi:MAG: hypothetical protein KGM17_06175 [Sphingomonadales bacterium]|nr:hypothetical protein [Sphingomonadales bacterium]